MTKKIYKFRAECIADVLKFMRRARFKYTMQIEATSLFPDVVVTLSTKENIESIISIFNRIPDTHVILQTIQPNNLYTGERITKQGVKKCQKEQFKNQANY